MNKVLRRLHLDNKRFVTSEEIKEYCRIYRANYYNTIRNLLSRGYLVRIFKGIFYVKNFDEVKLNRLDVSHLELISRGLELKGVENWYFGLYTALKLNNVTHEYYPVDYVISDKIFRYKNIDIVGYKIRFIKLKGDLFKFGIIEDRYRFSDLEKTVLDFIYIWRYNGIPVEKITMDISGYIEGVSKDKIRRYSMYYPKTIRSVIEALI